MKRISKLAWLLLAFMSACSAPVPSTSEVPHTPLPSVTPSQDSLEAATPASNLDPTRVQVDVSSSYQRIDGFGATHKALVHQGTGSKLSPELRAQAIEAIYQRVGVNLGNVEGALLESPGSYEQRSNDNDDPNEFNWAGFQTFGADAIQSQLLAFAEPYGFNVYYIDQRVNLRWASPWLAELRNTDYALFLEEAAEQVAAGHIYWRDKYGIVPRYMMPFNEPMRGNKELQTDNIQEIVDLVKAIGRRLEQEGFSDVRFVLPNEERIGRALRIAEAVLSDPEARKYVGVIGYHSYPYDSPYANIPKLLRASGAGTPDPDSVAAREKLREISQKYDLPVWMTEVSHGDVDPTSYEDFRGRAIHIHDELVYAGASAYFGMNNMWDTTSQQEHFGDHDLFANSSEGTIVLIDNNKQEMYITGMGYAIGHYARWVEPGAVRVEALSEDPLVQITAFKSPDSNQLILVLINNHPAPQEIQVEVKGVTLLGNVAGEQSTASQYWAPLEEFQVSTPASFEITLPLESVTTLILPVGRN
jgi:O-glycosyl hydrolase